MTVYKIESGEEFVRTTSKVWAKHVAKHHEHKKITPNPIAE